MFNHQIGEDIELRLLQDRYTEELFALVDRNREYLREWMPWLDDVIKVEDERKFDKKSLESFARGELLPLTIWYRGKIAGIVSLMDTNASDRKGEIGYWVSEDQQGKDLVTRACAAVISYGFNELGLNRLVIRAAVENSRSRAVAERLGFTYEGTERQSEWHSGHFNDLAVYSLLAEEWRNREQS
jgi:ribosomal-protein-serine acetyltransferase